MTAIHCAFAGSGANSVGPEIITNGSFAVDANWTKGADWTISAGAARYASGGSGTGFYQDLLDINAIGNTYRLTFTIVSGTGSVYATLIGTSFSVGGATRTGVGTYQEDIILSAGAGNFERLRFNGSSSSAFAITNVSVVRVY